MENMALAHVNPEMLVWARTRANVTPEQISRGFTDVEKILAWESEDQVPTFSQVEHLAKKFRVPLLALFLTAPPQEQPVLPDLRTMRNAGRKKLSANLTEVITDAVVRQDWYREEFPRAKPRILSKAFTVDDDAAVVADHLRRALWVNDDLIAECSDWNDFLLKLAANA